MPRKQKHQKIQVSGPWADLSGCCLSEEKMLKEGAEKRVLGNLAPREQVLVSQSHLELFGERAREPYGDGGQGDRRREKTAVRPGSTNRVLQRN